MVYNLYMFSQMVLPLRLTIFLFSYYRPFAVGLAHAFCFASR